MLKDALVHVPNKPGSYQMKSADGTIIYVGKAKDLKKRLTSYFTGSHDYKTTKMIASIDHFEYIVTHSELEALILELDFIKKYQPRYNILLMDDKSYPYIEITKEKHPKLVVTRTAKKRNKKLFGPYPNVTAARDTLRLLNKLYPLRKCHKLPKEPCLYYHLGQCLAPCINKVTPETYQTLEKQIKQFLRGETKDVINQLKAKMYEASERLEFERAKEYKDTIDAIQTTTTKQSVNLSDLKDRDIIGIMANEDYVAIEIFFIRNGAIHARDKKLMAYYVDADQAALEYIAQFYTTYPTPKEVLINDMIDTEILEALIHTPVRTPLRGEKKKLLDIACLNATQTLEVEKEQLKKDYDRTFKALDELGALLNVPTPYHIEAFDNSHLFGTYPVSSMVVFKNARPSKQDYRKYKLETTDKQSGDTDQMKEVLYRRYRRMLLEDEDAPHLILVDGGIGQINAAKIILKSLNLTIPIAGLVKSKDHKTHHLLTEHNESIELKMGTTLFTLLAYIQEEAHRFAITFHKDLRNKGVYSSVLDSIEGVGPTTKNKLLKAFKSIERIRDAHPDALKKLGINEPTIHNILTTLNQDD